MSNLFINQANKNKKDEFYTQYSDIENEIYQYPKNIFKDKIVYCNCDNPEISNFYKFFKDNFKDLGLKKLISSHIDFECNSYSISYDGIDEIKSPLKQNGDFRSDECIEILKESDIVVTNPPFSLFREFIAQLMKYDKKFLIIGNINAITLKDIFPLIRDKRMWLGYGFGGMYGHFFSPYEDTANATDHKDGMIRVSGVVWFQNIYDINMPDIKLNKIYDSLIYPKYDDYNAIEVSKAVNIPKDYNDLMGVPITFYTKLDYKRFKIVDMITPILNGKKLYKRLIIKRLNT